MAIFRKDIMTNEINYSEIAHRILGKLKKLDIDNGESLYTFWMLFKHLRLKDEYELDAYYTGNSHGGCYKFYARHKDILEVFIESENLKKQDFGCYLDLKYKNDTNDDWDDDWGGITPATSSKNIETSQGSDTYLEGQPIQGEVSHRTSRELIPSVFNYIEYELNEQSAWELFLLNESFRFMPLFWHAGYARCTFIFERTDLERLVSKPIRHWNGKERVDITADVAAYLDDESLLPKVTMLSENEALVRYTYWNSWRGLVRAEMKITKENGTTTFTDINRETLVEYHCGLIF